MKRLISVIVLSFTLSVVFTFTASAEFNIYDSNNLSSIASDAASLESYTRSISSTLSSVSTTVNYIYNSVSSIYTNSNYLPTISTTLNNISSSLSYLSSIQSNTAKLSDIEENTSHLSDISTSVSSLPSIDNNVEGIYSSTSNIFDQITNLLNSFISFNSYFSSFVSRVYSYLDSLNSYLHNILFYPPSFFGDSALVYFDHYYFNYTNVGSFSGSSTFNDAGYVYLDNVTSFYLFNSLVNNRIISYSFTSGTYIISFNYPGPRDDSLSIDFFGVRSGSYDYEILSQSDTGYDSYSVVIQLNVYNSFSSSRIGFHFSSFVTGMFYGGIASASSDFIANNSINPDQESTVSDVDDAGYQQSQQEDQMWQNINTYKGDISFNLDGWDDAAGGLSYVTGVFMTIWNNSPTQPIVLSLMLGIAMLSIGRGVMAAVRVSRNRGDD